MWVDSGNGIYFQMWTKQKKEQKCWRVQWQNWEGRHLKSCQMMRSVFFAFLFGLAVAAIRILPQFVEAIWLWQAGGKRMILKGLFFLQIMIMIQLFKREILPLQKEIHLHQHKSEHLSNQHVVQ